MRTGRPSKFNEAVREKVVATLRTGASMKDAAAKAGVSYHSVYGWIRRGERSESGVYRLFADECRKALDEAHRAAREAKAAARSQVARRTPRRRDVRARHAVRPVDPDEITLDEKTRRRFHDLLWCGHVLLHNPPELTERHKRLDELLDELSDPECKRVNFERLVAAVERALIICSLSLAINNGSRWLAALPPTKTSRLFDAGNFPAELRDEAGAKLLHGAPLPRHSEFMVRLRAVDAAADRGNAPSLRKWKADLLHEQIRRHFRDDRGRRGRTVAARDEIAAAGVSRRTADRLVSSFGLR